MPKNIKYLVKYGEYVLGGTCRCIGSAIAQESESQNYL